MNKKEIFLVSAFKDNPIWRQILGICSSLAVTNLVLNSLIMGLSVTFTLIFSNLTISFIRNYTPRNVRMIAQTLIIGAYVIIVDIFLKAKIPEVSKQLGPYVGLIITNCILMGRAEAFAAKNAPFDSVIDGLGSGLGYTMVLVAIAVIREIFGFGSLLGIPVLGTWWIKWSIMVMAPSAFFLLASLIWFINTKYYKIKMDKGA